MDSKEDIVGADEVVLSIVALPVFLLDLRAVVEGEVEDRVAEEAEDVEVDEIH